MRGGRAKNLKMNSVALLASSSPNTLTRPLGINTFSPSATTQDFLSIPFFVFLPFICFFVMLLSWSLLGHHLTARKYIQTASGPFFIRITFPMLYRKECDRLCSSSRFMRSPITRGSRNRGSQGDPDLPLQHRRRCMLRQVVEVMNSFGK